MEDSKSSDVGVISVNNRIPQFWQDAAKLWFIQFEAVVKPLKQADYAEFQIVTSKLSKDEIKQVADILERPPETKKYETLKARLISIYEESNAQKLKTLLGDLELGDLKPSHLLRRMKDLANNQLSEDAIKIIWEQKLPKQIQTVLPACSSSNMDELAGIADRIADTLQTQRVNEVTSIDKTVQELQEGIRYLMQIVTPGRFRQRSRSAQSPRRRPRSSSRSRTPQIIGGKCWYHRTYKDKAQKCSPGCELFSQKN